MTPELVVVDPERRSWVPVPEDSDFPLANLSYGIVSPPHGAPGPHVAIGDHALDLAAVAQAGLFDDVLPDAAAVLTEPTLNAFFARGREAWNPVRARLVDLLTEGDTRLADGGLAEAALRRRDTVTPCVPAAVGDYVDFYSSLEHATNLGRIMRPGSEPLLPNWRHLPVGYHGRSSTIVASGADVPRPLGQQRPPAEGRPPVFGPSQRLDFELEVGFLTGPGNARGEAIPTSRAADHVAGLVLVNDWSARDVQAWEYQPLGPFLGKSFATSVSPWVVPLDALEPFRVPQRPQDPPVRDYLRVDADWSFDVHLEVAVAPDGGDETVVCQTNLRHLYWTVPQQLTHVTSNGASVRPGDLYASGTVSGPDPGTYGSLIELTWGGTAPLALTDGPERTFLDDGDVVVMRAHAGGGDRPRIGFGEVRGRVLPAGSLPGQGG